MAHHALCRLIGQALVVVARIHVATVARPVLAHDFFHRLLAHREDVQPEQHRPQSVFFAHVIRAGAKAFLAAQGHFSRIHQVAEKLPAGGRFKAGNVQGLRHAIHRRAGRHRTRHAGQALAVGGHQRGVGGEQREAVRRGDEEFIAQDHIAVAITVGGRAKIRCLVAIHDLDQIMRIGQVGVGVAAAKIFQRHGIHQTVGRRTEAAL